MRDTRADQEKEKSSTMKVVSGNLLLISTEVKKHCIQRSFTVKVKKDGVMVEVAMQHNDSYTENSYGFVNNIITPEGGTHIVGFRNALTKTFNEHRSMYSYVRLSIDRCTATYV